MDDKSDLDLIEIPENVLRGVAHKPKRNTRDKWPLTRRMIPPEIKRRFLRQVPLRPKDPDSCWPFRPDTKTERPVFGMNGYTYLGYQVAYVLWVGDIEDGSIQFVCHKCDNGKCVRGSHLFLGSRWDNVDDAVSKKRYPSGQHQGSASTTNRTADKLRKIYAQGGVTQTELAKRFGLSIDTVHSIVHNAHYRRTTDDS